jgi:mersacidin/lichenicidin family type 2 lantibiotic
MDVPEGINVNVVENTDTTVHVTLPAAPEGHTELSDEELENAAGGWKVCSDQHQGDELNTCSEG